MTNTEVMALLKENKNERGIANWRKTGERSGRLKSYGIGLTQLRKMAKRIGRDHKLAQRLWKSNVYDAKIIGLLVDDNSCEPLDVLKHLTGDYIKQELGT